MEVGTPNEAKINKALVERFNNGAERVSVEKLATELDVPNSEIRQIAVGYASTRPENLVIIDYNAYVMKSWMKNDGFFKRCVRCGREIVSWDNRNPLHCYKCGVETGSIKEKFEHKWHHHLNLKMLRSIHTAVGMGTFTRKWLLYTTREKVWGYNMAADDVTYYLIRAGLIKRIRPGLYKITETGRGVISGRLTRQEVIKAQVQKEYQEAKKNISDKHCYLERMT